MRINRRQLKANYLQSINWLKNDLVDWVSGGNIYKTDGTFIDSLVSFKYKFNAAKTSNNGIYSVIYERLGTKALLLKNGELLRELNRSYYCADDYDYPINFIELANGITLLIHCPKDYNRIDIEVADTGELLTDIPERKPADFFHSRFEISPTNKILLSKGWAWHPVDDVLGYNIDDCLKNPLLLDGYGFFKTSATEVSAGSIINDNLILLGTSDLPSFNYNDPKYDLLPPKHIGIWDIAQDRFINFFPAFDTSLNLIAINEEYAWDVYRFPKVINLKTGSIETSFEDIDCGLEGSSILPDLDLEKHPSFTFNKTNNTLAIGFNDRIELLEFLE